MRRRQTLQQEHEQVPRRCVAGVRQDLRPGDAQTWAAFGFQGFAPYRIDVELTGYLGAGGRSQLRVDAAHDLRLTRRLVAQTRLEATLVGKPDAARERGHPYWAASDFSISSLPPGTCSAKVL